MKYNVEIPGGWGTDDRDRPYSVIMRFLDSGAENAEIAVDQDENARYKYVRYSNAIGYHKLRDRVTVKMRNNRIFLIRLAEKEEQNNG